MRCDCGDKINPRRVALGYQTCPVCGDREARRIKRCVVPLNKSNYMLISNYTELKMLNPKSNNA
jgi:predicted RNA-binding Zn-ribbon protein involved in translation (DUF1610 family)